MSENVKIVQVSSDASPVELQRECIIKSVIIQNAGSDPTLQLYNCITGIVGTTAAPIDQKIGVKVDASVQGFLTQIPLWDLYFDVGVYVTIGNGVAWIIYETGQKNTAKTITGVPILKGSKVVHVDAVSGTIQKQVTGPTPFSIGVSEPKESGEITTLKGILIQGSGSDTEVRVWDYIDMYENAPDRNRRRAPLEKRALDLKIDATYQGFCVPVDCHDLVFNKGIFVNVTNGSAYFIFEQKEAPK